jgi:signal peptide peptidase SppA
MNLANEILRGAFFIEPFHGMSIAMQVYAHLNEGKPLSLRNEFAAEEKETKSFVFTPHTLDENGEAYDLKSSAAFSKKNSLAIIPVREAITKYDYCGSPGTMSLEGLINKALAANNVTAIILTMDTPGGSAVPSIKLTNFIKQAAAQKPIFAFVDEMAASAGMMIASACTEIIASSKFDMVGSIGTMMSWANFKKMYEMKGVEFHEVYATLSINKNKIFSDANKGNYDELIKKMLDPLNEEFIGMVKANRAERLDNTNKEVFTGEIFSAEKAMSFGLIDGITNFDSLITKARAFNKPKMKRYVV